MDRRGFASAAAFVFMALIGTTVAGCNGPVKVEPVVFQDDECIRGDGFLVLADRRVFATMAFLNACGYDAELPGVSMHRIRVKVRELVSHNLESYPEKLRAWRKYYSKRRTAPWQYVDFALSLNSDYPFRRIRLDSELGYSRTARVLANFPKVLNDFWATARLDEVWAQYKSDYMAEVKKYDLDRMTRRMAFIWEYLRQPRHDTYVIVQISNPLERHGTASGARYENYFYSIDGARSNYGLNVHEYLHTIINPLVQAHYDEFKDKLDKYYRAGKDAEISKPYQKPKTFASECFVHALDYRLAGLQTSDPQIKKYLNAKIAKLTKDGYHLLAPFYKVLAEYEQSDLTFKQFFPVLLERLPEYSSSAAVEQSPARPR